MRGLCAFLINPKTDARNGPYAKLYKDVRVYACSGVDALMAIKEYLNHRVKHLAKTSREEAKPIIDRLLGYATSGIANHLLIRILLFFCPYHGT